jgi:hypothetical protein
MFSYTALCVLTWVVGEFANLALFSFSSYFLFLLLLFFLFLTLKVVVNRAYFIIVFILTD